jgi:hypothetical protein
MFQIENQTDNENYLFNYANDDENDTKNDGEYSNMYKGGYLAKSLFKNVGSISKNRIYGGGDKSTKHYDGIIIDDIVDEYKDSYTRFSDLVLPPSLVKIKPYVSKLYNIPENTEIGLIPDDVFDELFNMVVYKPKGSKNKTRKVK